MCRNYKYRSKLTTPGILWAAIISLYQFVNKAVIGQNYHGKNMESPLCSHFSLHVFSVISLC